MVELLKLKNKVQTKFTEYFTYLYEHKKVSLPATVLIITLLFLLLLNRKEETTPITSAIKTLPPRSVYLGAWVGGFWDNSSRTLNTNALSEFEQTIDKKVAIANIFTDWTYLANPDYLNVLNAISDKGWTPMISSNPGFFKDCPKSKDSLYKTIASGKCDTHLIAVAQNLKSYEKPILLRFAWEMNLPDMYWSIAFLKSTPQEFVDAWKHFYTILQNENATNVKWVLSFNTSSGKTVPYKELYPGHEYVDWVAIDGYNWGTSVDWSGWTNFNGVFKKSYDELIAISHKPVMFSEVNSSPDGGNKAEWLKDMLKVQIPNNYPQVQAVVFFN